tara:strand:+ start:710 stop:901 length:192 start_codon:yes stop_codon:yes gene_type:complete
LKELEELNDNITESLKVYIEERPYSSIEVDLDTENLVINLKVVLDDGAGDDIEGRIFENRSSV